MPASIRDLNHSDWYGKIAIAKPLNGTTATHAAVLFSELGDEKAKAFFNSLKSNKVKIEGGNKDVAVNVGSGRLAFGMTDTDDAMIELAKGSPVKIIYPDSGADQQGTLFIPNTVALIKNSPNQKNAEKLMNYLLSARIEMQLASSSSHQIPLHKDADRTSLKVKTPADIKAMQVDFYKAAKAFNQSARYLADDFLR